MSASGTFQKYFHVQGESKPCPITDIGCRASTIGRLDASSPQRDHLPAVGRDRSPSHKAPGVGGGRREWVSPRPSDQYICMRYKLLVNFAVWARSFDRSQIQDLPSRAIVSSASVRARRR